MQELVYLLFWWLVLVGLNVALDAGLVSFLSLVDRMINKPFVNTGYTGQGGAGQ